MLTINLNNVNDDKISGFIRYMYWLNMDISVEGDLLVINNSVKDSCPQETKLVKR